MTWSPNTSTGHEAEKIKYLTVPYTHGTGLDVGCGPSRIWPQSIGIDRWVSDQGASVVCDVADLSLFADKSMDYVFSSHVLEDFAEGDSVKILTEWWRPIKSGGHLILYLPHEKLYPKVGTNGANPAHLQDLSPEKVMEFMTRIKTGFELLESEVRVGGNEYSFFMVFKKRMDGKKVTTLPLKSAKPRALVIRYGGIGDMIQASSIFPGLRKQGYEVHVNTTPQGQDYIKHDPNVDGWLIQEKDQVPNGELTKFFRSIQERYDLVVNLCESVEGTLLSMPGRPDYNFPLTLQRKKVGHINYLERTHEIAKVPFEPAAKFYPSKAEDEQAKKTRREMDSDFVILWSLSGSSAHKSYPHTDTVIARLMIQHPGAKVVTVGDGACRILEAGWVDEPRVYLRSGEWTIRETLAFAKYADMVVGPETGVLNSVGLDPMPKVCMLSHSSEANLTKHWKNTVALKPEGVGCHPCHRLHYGGDYCYLEEETHSAMCSFKLDPDVVYQAITLHIKRKKAA